MNPWRKLVAGDDIRPTRLHTEAGEFTGLTALPGLLPAFLTWSRCKLTGHYQLKPWWVWKAITHIEAALKPDDRVLEIGSGFSSLWLAGRTAHVHALEEVDAWADRIEGEAATRRLDNLRIQRGDSPSLLADTLASRSFDVVVIDSPDRRLQMFRALLDLEAARRPRLVIYDDTDKAENRAALQLAVPAYGVTRFRGFKPQTLHACETSVFSRSD